jgi:hypothetical protein
VTVAVYCNVDLFLPWGQRSPKRREGPFQRMMTVHIRRGDFGPACTERVL